MNIPIIYEDSDIIVVNKPAGVVTHPDKDHKEGTLIQEVLKIRPDIAGVGEDPLRPGIVHRLDKETSGVLLVARNQKAFEFLKSQFGGREIKKKYIALVQGNVKENSGVIDLPIGKSGSDFRKKLASEKASGKLRKAITDYKVLERFRDYTLIEAYPKTGRTHQIRAHLKAIGYPVACDSLYGGKRQVCPFGLERHFLHANFLEFSMPGGSRMKIEADLPEDLQDILQILRKKQ